MRESIWIFFMPLGTLIGSSIDANNSLDEESVFKFPPGVAPPLNSSPPPPTRWINQFIDVFTYSSKF